MRKPYRSDLTDAQWGAIKGLLPAPKPTGRPRTVDLREVVNTLMYQARTGCQWDYLPHDLAAKSTAWDYFVAWQADGTWQKVVDALRGEIRKEAGREESPSAACIDTQTVKSTEMGGEVGYDGGKKVKGRKRHIVVDTMGLAAGGGGDGGQPRRRHARPRGAGQAAGGEVPQAEEGLRGQQVQQQGAEAVDGAQRGGLRDRGRQQAGGGGVQAGKGALGGGAVARLPGPVQAPEQGLRAADELERGVGPAERDPAHGAPAEAGP